MEFDLPAAVARYFEQHARNEKSIADLKKSNKQSMDDLKEEIEVGHRNAFAYAMGECGDQEMSAMLSEEIKRRLDEK